MKYLGPQGQTYWLGNQIAAGGEGAIYEITGLSQLVAKLYHSPPSTRKAAKLAAMVAMASDEIAEVAAWPVATLHAVAGGPPVGIVMPKIEAASEMHELDSPAHRRTHFPAADWRFLVRAARNCAASVQTMHSNGIVIGDINNRGFLVSKDALVKVIDCDSFQLKHHADVFYCDVAVPEFLPPELHGSPLSSTLRTANHDAFGLAVVIFRLLMMGRHPFAGYRGSGDKPIPQLIKEFRFAFGHDAAAFQMAPPPHSLLLADLSPELNSLFMRAFSKGSNVEGVRPHARRWAEALSRFEAKIRRCANDPSHFYYEGLADCPWCRIQRGLGPHYFISVCLQSLSAPQLTIEIASIWSKIQAITHPKQAFDNIRLPRDSESPPKGMPAGVTKNWEIVRVLGVLVMLSPLLGLLGLHDVRFLYLAVGIFLVLAAAWFITYSSSSFLIEVRKRRLRFKNRTSELSTSEQRIKRAVTHYTHEFDARLREAKEAKQAFESLDQLDASEMEELQASAKESQLREYLDRNFIRNARLEKIGPERVATLEAYNIETAADVELAALQNVPGLGSALSRSLLEWRKGLEKQFRFEAARGIPAAEMMKLRSRQSQRRYELSSKLTNLASELARISEDGKNEIVRLSDEYIARLKAYYQAKADLAVCS
ncbi:helix-hairpin-helix domain-containing protein [Anatilimnocola sp. NA78]|uniref:helix-hairpin-helix domain-containing protein n=1 Tax=Anatilimnocola sp. NA78 TaxID=3415683 RepID=UPI003CE539CC